jgi:hypothetical protein
MADGNYRQRGAPSIPSSGNPGNPYRLSDIELQFVELMAKGFDPLAASRSLGISYLSAAQMQRRLSKKLNALNENHFRHLVQTIARSMPAERYAVLEA